MLNFLRKYFISENLELYESFANDINHFLISKLNISQTQIKSIKVFYNDNTISCIVQIIFKIQDSKELREDYFYFHVNCYQSEISQYGQKFQDTLSVSKGHITWINENKILKFYHENSIDIIINSKLSKQH